VVGPLVPDLSVEQANAVEQARQLARYRKMRDVFLETFGPPGQRTPHGALILEELEKFVRWRKPIREKDSAGRTDIYATAVREGRREVVQAIHDLIEWRESEHVNPSERST
jgi:hypothetical protein